jgi:transposase
VAFEYVPVDRDQLFLLPPDMRDWLPGDHLVWFVVDIVDSMDVSKLDELHPRDGVGRPAFDPRMMLALLFYAYATGERSTRRIATRCQTDIAFRIACANTIPDHATIARFRVQYGEIAEQLFLETLRLCAAAGLLDSELIAVDGTKMAGSAALRSNRTQAQIDEELQALASAAFRDSGDIEPGSDANTGSKPRSGPGSRRGDRGGRDGRLEKARADLTDADRREAEQRRELEAQRQSRHDQAAAHGHGVRGRAPRGQEVAKAQAALDRARQRWAEHNVQIIERARARGDQRFGGPRKHPEGRIVARAEKHLEQTKARFHAAGTFNTDDHTTNDHTTDDAVNDDAVNDRKANITDPDSRIMKTATGWLQGYNPQAAVNTHGIVVAFKLTNEQTDYGQCVPMMTLITSNLAATSTSLNPTLLFDAGYYSEDNLNADGPERLIAYTKSWKLDKTTPQTQLPPDATRAHKMRHRLATPEGRNLYKQRSHIIETLFGQTKHNRTMRYFLLRGLSKVKTEWATICLTHNLTKLAAHTN